MQEYFTELISTIKNNKPSKDDIARLKIKLCNKYKLKHIPTDIEVLLNADKDELKALKFLQTKPVRSISGVAPVAIMTKPIACKHGRCIYCPGGPGSYFGDMPQSYTGHEPSTMRGIRNNYDPYLMVMNRLEQYALLGHNFDKVELIVMGGTFPSFDKEYKDEFITYALKAMNDFSIFFKDDGSLDIQKFKVFFELPGDIKDREREKRIQAKVLKLKENSNLETERKRNETANVRCTAMVIETKPDWCLQPEIDEMLNFGTTRVEVGIQHLDNDILKKTNRGHSIKESILCTQLMRDSLLKITYHMMPGQPGSTLERDKEMFKEIFTNPDFKPDALKIYPCMVSPGTPLYELWKKGEFTPITTEEAAKVIAECKRYVPKWCRIMRVQRDIPPKHMAAGVDRSNLRQYVDEECRKLGIKCQCIRCREPKNKEISWDNVKLLTEEYRAANSTEIFLSYEDVKNNILLGFCRLRKPWQAFRKEITAKSVGIRELHVYGQALGIGEDGDVNAIQHRGLGTKLLQKAEEIAADNFDSNKMVIISGIGVREYYKKFGYSKEGAYMVKTI